MPSLPTGSESAEFLIQAGERFSKAAKTLRLREHIYEKMHHSLYKAFILTYL